MRSDNAPGAGNLCASMHQPPSPPVALASRCRARDPAPAPRATAWLRPRRRPTWTLRAQRRWPQRHPPPCRTATPARRHLGGGRAARRRGVGHRVRRGARGTARAALGWVLEDRCSTTRTPCTWRSRPAARQPGRWVAATHPATGWSAGWPGSKQPAWWSTAWCRCRPAAPRRSATSDVITAAAHVPKVADPRPAAGLARQRRRSFTLRLAGGLSRQRAADWRLSAAPGAASRWPPPPSNGWAGRWPCWATPNALQSLVQPLEPAPVRPGAQPPRPEGGARLACAS